MMAWAEVTDLVYTTLEEQYSGPIWTPGNKDTLINRTPSLGPKQPTYLGKCKPLNKDTLIITLKCQDLGLPLYTNLLKDTI